MMEKGWEKVYTTDQMHRAQLIKDLLEDSGINAVIFNKQDSSYVMIGEIEVYVKQENVLRALNRIKKQVDE